MAILTAGAGFGRASGRVGNMVLSATQGGTVMRERPLARGAPSEAQIRQGLRMALVNQAWDALSPEECLAWRAYAVGLATRNPATGGMRIPQAYGLFSGLSMKYLQIHGGHEMPSLPPEGRFVGDVIQVAVVGDGADVLLTADGTNRPGTLTEIWAQRLTGRNNLPKARSYVSRGFFSFEAGQPIRLPIGMPGTWAFAAKFVEASSGRMTELVPFGRAAVTEWPFDPDAAESP